MPNIGLLRIVASEAFNPKQKRNTMDGQKRDIQFQTETQHRGWSLTIRLPPRLNNRHSAGTVSPVSVYSVNMGEGLGMGWGWGWGGGGDRSASCDLCVLNHCPVFRTLVF